MVSQSELFIFTLFVICSFFYQTHQNECEGQIETVVDCWLHYGDPPACNDGKSALAMCAEDRLSRVANCTTSVYEKIEHMVDSYSELELAVCEDSDLRTEIVKRKSCWPVLRSCALQVLMADSTDVECKEVIDVVQTCSDLSHGCTEVYYTYIKAILSQSKCKNFKLEYTEEVPESSFVVGNTSVRFLNQVFFSLTSFIVILIISI